MLPVLPTMRVPESGGVRSALLWQTRGLPGPGDLAQQALAQSLLGRRFLLLGTAPSAATGAGLARLFSHHADAGNVGTGEDDLYSDTLAAGQLANNDEVIEAYYAGTFVSSATATRQVRVYFGGTAVFDSGALTLSLSSAWELWVTVVRVSSSVVRVGVSMTTEGAALAAYTAYTEVTGLTLANTQVLKVTAEAAGVGAATNDVVAKLGTVEYKPVTTISPAAYPTGSASQSVLTTYSIAAASGTWVDTGVGSLALPAAGTYLVWANLRYDFVETGGSFLSARLYDTTGAAALADTERLLKYNGGSATESGEAGCDWLVVVTTARTIDLSLRRTGTFTQSDITSNSDGRSTLGYVRLS